MNLRKIASYAGTVVAVSAASPGQPGVAASPKGGRESGQKIEAIRVLER
jgi:hypothetical protein